MNKFIIIGIIIAIIIGIVSIVSASMIEDVKEGIKSIPESTEKVNANQSMPQGRNLSIEFDEKMGFSAP